MKRLWWRRTIKLSDAIRQNSSRSKIILIKILFIKVKGTEKKLSQFQFFCFFYFLNCFKRFNIFISKTILITCKIV